MSDALRAPHGENRLTVSVVCLTIAALLFAAWSAFSLFNLVLGATLGPDAGFFLMRAILIGEGKVPYQDFATMYLPGSYFLQAWLFDFGLTSPAAVRASQAGMTLLVGFLMGAVCAGITKAPPWLACSVMAGYFYFVPALEGIQYHAESPSAVFGWGALLLLGLVGECPSRGNAWKKLILLFLAGLCGGLAGWIKQAGFIFLLPIAVWLAKRGSTTGERCAAALGAFAPAAAYFLYAPQTFGDVVSSSVIGLFSYALIPHKGAENHLREALSTVRGQWWIPTVIFVALLHAGWRKERGQENRSPVAILCTGLLLVMPSFSHPYAHYFLYPLPFAMLAIGQLVAAALRRSALLGSGVLIIAAVLLQGSATGAARGVWVSLISSGEFRRQEDEKSAWIKARSQGATKVLILPDSPQFYFLGNLRAPLDAYDFWGKDRQLDVALELGLPLFVVDRGHSEMGHLREALVARGLVVIASRAGVEQWGRIGAAEQAT